MALWMLIVRARRCRDDVLPLSWLVGIGLSVLWGAQDREGQDRGRIGEAAVQPGDTAACPARTHDPAHVGDERVESRCVIATLPGPGG
ncbi:hypothetical protein FIBSPDRAFT_871154 [Athelia psychrophila]|uniref:Uncharacterized protein n=1 Tax=Athelia psychrophila TaxID=1759441 RepID=A0A166AH41_9AGAM|nr:hypothetical protein FIBSPDRAFT_871154 [Fibularhizoctonia sp. CBS 109695]